MLKTILRLAVVLLLGLSLPGVARAQVFSQPWNLAVVVAGSPALEKSWPDKPLREVLTRALTIELRTLPLRITAGVWLAGAETKQLVPPSPAAKLKRLELEIPAVTSPTDATTAIRAALDWLREQGSGALIVLAAGGDLGQVKPESLELPKGKIFCHSMGLGQADPGQALAGLALAGGGGCRAAKDPDRLPFMLRRLFRAALSPARLEISTHNPENQPVDLTLDITRRKRKEAALPVKSNRPIQLLAGVYEISWPKDSGAGPGPLPELASVDREGLTRVWAGGQGELAVRAMDAEGEALDWRIKVSAQGDGRLMTPERRTPFEFKLPAGYYIAAALHPPLAWNFEVRPGQKVDLVAGPKGELTLVLKGPAGPARLPYEVYSLLEGRRVATGYTNAHLRLLPGPYRISLESAPALDKEISLAPGERKEMELPSLGSLLVAKAGPEGPAEYLVADIMGRVFAQGRTGKGLLLLPGIYRLKTAEGDEGPKVRIMGGQVCQTELPQRAH